LLEWNRNISSGCFGDFPLASTQRKTGLLPELIGAQTYKATEFDEKVDWMMKRGLLNEAPKYEEIVRNK